MESSKLPADPGNRSGKLGRLVRLAGFLGLLFVLPLNAQELTLNLKDADINALIGTISELTGKNFIIDPRVKGKVTVISSRPMQVNEAYQVFLSILKVHGFAAVPAGSVIRIVPDVNAKQDNIPVVGANNPGIGDNMVTRVIQVENVAAAQLVPILRPLVPQQGHLAAYAGSNVLILSDRARNIERLVQIIRRVDTASDTEIEVIPLHYASANEIVRILSSLLNKPTGAKGAPPASKVTLAADERTNSVLLAGERSSRLRARVTIAQLDTRPEETGNTHVVYLRYSKAEDLVPVLTGLSKTKQQAKAKGKQVAAQKAGPFDIQADPATNALVITAPPDIFRSLQSVIRKLDIRRAQVLIEGIIAEVSPTKSADLGVQWRVTSTDTDSKGAIGGTNFTNTGTSILGLAVDPINNIGNGLTLGYIDGTVSVLGTDVLNLGVLIDAFAADGMTNVLATPSLLTMDNQEAEFVVAENIPFQTGSFTTDASGASNPFQTIDRQDVGLILKVKPQINEGDTIQLEISQEISNVTGAASDLNPITLKRSIKTNVLVDDGHVLVLGGLINEQVSESVQKVPFLGDLPLLGALFRSKSTDLRKTNLMIFLQPKILREANAARVATTSKYNYIRAQQLQQRGKLYLLPGDSRPLMPEFSESGKISVTPTMETRIPEAGVTDDQ